MPKKDINYESTDIYFHKICCTALDITEIYIGHTVGFLTRKSKHKNRCSNGKDKSYNLYVYQFIRENGGWGNWSMVLVEIQKLNDRLEVFKYERELIEKYNATLNKNYT